MHEHTLTRKIIYLHNRMSLNDQQEYHFYIYHLTLFVFICYTFKRETSVKLPLYLLLFSPSCSTIYLFRQRRIVILFQSTDHVSLNEIYRRSLKPNISGSTSGIKRTCDIVITYQSRMMNSWPF